MSASVVYENKKQQRHQCSSLKNSFFFTVGASDIARYTTGLQSVRKVYIHLPTSEVILNKCTFRAGTPLAHLLKRLLQKLYNITLAVGSPVPSKPHHSD